MGATSGLGVPSHPMKGKASMGKVARGMALVRQSATVLRDEPGLLALPVVAAVAQTAIVLVYVWGVVGWDRYLHAGRLGVLWLYPVFLPSAVLSSWATAAIVKVVHERLEGRAASWRDGLVFANSALPTLAAWALLTTTVGVVLRLLQERAGFLGRLVFGSLGVGWSLATSFVVPVIVVERAKPVPAARRSLALFRARWGEQMVGDGAIGVALAVIVLPVMALSACSFAAGIPIGVLVLAVEFSLFVAVSQALGSVFQTALYQYAVTGSSGDLFARDELEGAFRPRRSALSSGPQTQYGDRWNES